MLTKHCNRIRHDESTPASVAADRTAQQLHRPDGTVGGAVASVARPSRTSRYPHKVLFEARYSYNPWPSPKIRLAGSYLRYAEHEGKHAADALLEKICSDEAGLSGWAARLQRQLHTRLDNAAALEDLAAEWETINAEGEEREISDEGNLCSWITFLRPFH